MSDRKITIVIPIYNTPLEDLKRCFDSLYNQTNQNFNIVAVNDGSEGYVKEYLDSLSFSIIGLKVFHKSNSGLPSTKNYALNYVDTEYVCFCDSDDTYCLDFIEKSYKYIEKYEPDMICANMNYIPKWNTQLPIDKEYYFDEYSNVLKVRDSMFEFTPRDIKFNVNVCSCGKVYKSKIVKEISFDINVTFGEDQLFNRKYLQKVTSVLLVRDYFYNYYQNEYSMTRKLLKEIPFSKYRPFWDCMYELDSCESDVYRQNLRVFNIRLLNGYVNRACGANYKSSFFNSLKKVDEAVLHPMIQDALKNVKIFNNTISLLNSINVIMLRFKMNWLYLLEKRLIYRLHLNKDKI